MKNSKYQTLAKGHDIRNLAAADKEAELKWYTDKYCMKMDGTSKEATKEWCCGVGYGYAFALKLWDKIQAVTFSEGNFLRIDWDKTEF